MKKAFRWLILLSLFGMLGNLSAQNFTLHFQPVFSGKNMVLESPFWDKNGDSLAFHTLRFYVGNFVFLKNGQPVFSEKSHRLLDVEEEPSLDLAFQLPEKRDFDSLTFDLGVDSLTTVAGAMGGDLDPTRGMFWAWQSGYINVKLEGFHAKSTARNHAFEFHLGGYLPPFQTVQKIGLPAISSEKMRVKFDLARFFEQVDWSKNQNVMSPGAAAVAFSRQLAGLFEVF